MSEHTLQILDADGSPVCAVTLTSMGGDVGDHTANHIRELVEREYPNRVRDMHE